LGRKDNLEEPLTIGEEAKNKDFFIKGNFLYIMKFYIGLREESINSIEDVL